MINGIGGIDMRSRIGKEDVKWQIVACNGRGNIFVPGLSQTALTKKTRPPRVFYPSSFRLHPYPLLLPNISSLTSSNFKLIT